MSFFGFGQKPPQQVQKQQQAQTQDNTNPDSSSKPAPTGLDKFAALLDNGSNSNTPGQPPQRTNVQELFKNEDFMNGLRSNLRSNLSSSISDVTKQKLADNDPTAFLAAIQEVAEASYLQALQHSASLQDLVLNERMQDVQSNTENLVGKRLKDHQYLSAIPQLQNPIVQLGVNAFMEKVREQNPTISPEELKSQINEYVSELGKDLGAIQEPKDPATDVDKGIDWLQELGMEPPPAS